MATATPKLDLLAQMFMQQIQDPISFDANGNLQPGFLLNDLTKIQSFVGQAMQKYFTDMWDKSGMNKNTFLELLPECQAAGLITFNQYVTVMDLSLTSSGNFLNLFDILDSNYQTGIGSKLVQPPDVYHNYPIYAPLEVWDNKFLQGALNESDPFHAGLLDPTTLTLIYGGLIYDKPNLYLFPEVFTGGGAITFSLNYIAKPLDKTTGDYYKIDGTTDIPFHQNRLQAIADIATQLYRVADYEEDAG